MKATSDEDLFGIVQSEPPQELANTWQTLNRQEQEYISRLRANLTHVCERSKILARLAERLQTKVVELENRLEVKEPNS